MRTLASEKNMGSKKGGVVQRKQKVKSKVGQKKGAKNKNWGPSQVGYDLIENTSKDGVKVKR